MKIRARRLAGVSIAALSMGFALPAFAQDSAADPQQTAPTTEAIPGDQAAAQDGNGIVVYGLRRADTLQDTPAAITVVSIIGRMMP